MKRPLITLCLLCSAFAATAQDNTFILNAQLRTRGEYNNGAIKPRSEGQEAATFVNDRTRLSTFWKRGDLEMKMSVQHTGVWGQDDIKERNGRMAMNEAWARMRFGESFFAQIGRQQLSYDDERLLGGLDWNVAGNWHDALRLGYESPEHKVHFIGAFNQTAENDRGTFYNGPMPYKTMVALWYHYQSPFFSTLYPFGASVLIMNVGREVGTTGMGRTNFMQTIGTHLTYGPAPFAPIKAAASFYYQRGKNNAGKDVSAWMASAKLSYTVTPEISVNGGYDIESGNDGSKTVKAFDPLFGTHHKFFGAMDYFTGQMLSGIQDIHVGASTSAVKKVSLQFDYHYFLTARKVLNFDKGLGHELDLQFNTRIAKDVSLSGGYSMMLGTETMDVIKGGSHKSWQDWAWLSLNINPCIFSTRW